MRIRTCADSAIALLDLVKYIASDGDLHDGLSNDSATNHSKNSNDKILVTLEENEKDDIMGDGSDFNFSHGSLDGSSSKKEVPELVEEAMNDMTEITPPKKRCEYLYYCYISCDGYTFFQVHIEKNNNNIIKSLKKLYFSYLFVAASKKCRPLERRNIEVFYFPDENISRTKLVGEVLSEVLSESDSTDDDIETEFCIIEAESGIGYLVRTFVDFALDFHKIVVSNSFFLHYFQSNTKVPEVRLLTQEPIKMVDNHFTVPLGKEDVLKAPKNYPVPVSKYTLREMSIVWHMYGGSDFASSEEKDSKDDKKHVSAPADRLVEFYAATIIELSL